MAATTGFCPRIAAALPGSSPQQTAVKADTLVFTATMDGKTIATVEISLNDYSILQCRAFANDICKYTEQIANIINANKKMIAERQTA